MAAFNANGVTKQVTIQIKITGARRLRFRMWLASKVFVIGGWIAGLATDVSVKVTRAKGGRL